MVTRVLDSDICIAWLKGDARVRARLESLSPRSIALCSIVKAELLYGARKSGRVGANLRKLMAFFEPFDSLSFDDAAADEYATLRAHLETEGRPIGSNDMLIAAIAVAAGVTLVTRNVDEFERVPRLAVERW